MLIGLFGRDDVDRQTKGHMPDYPGICDFYIKTLSLYIELQVYWSHGLKKPYDENKKPDFLLDWEKRAESSLHYRNAVDQYSVRDVNKRKFALEHNLNYLELWEVPTLDFLVIEINRTVYELDYSYNEDECMKEFIKISSRKGDYQSSCFYNKIPLTHQPHFYALEKAMWKDENVKRSLIVNRCHYLNKREDQLTDREILRGFKISGIHYGFSHFNPFWIKAFI